MPRPKKPSNTPRSLFSDAHLAALLKEAARIQRRTVTLTSTTYKRRTTTTNSLRFKRHIDNLTAFCRFLDRHGCPPAYLSVANRARTLIDDTLSRV